MIADDEPVTLPFAVAVEAEDHTTDVNGSPIRFNGVRVTCSPRWSGSAVIGDVLVTITTTGQRWWRRLNRATTARFLTHDHRFPTPPPGEYQRYRARCCASRRIVIALLPLLVGRSRSGAAVQEIHGRFTRPARLRELRSC